VTVIEKKFEIGGRHVTLQTGHLAKQARASVLADVDGTSVLITLCTADIKEDRGFFPFSVHYHERAYAYGAIPGGFKKREGPPSEREALTSRLIDRPLRPLFPSEYQQEVQIFAFLLSSNPEVQPDVVALIGAAAALELANLPTLGTLGAIRLGLNAQGEFTVNPSDKETKTLDLVVAGTEKSIMMVEAKAQEISEEKMSEALEYAQGQIAQVVTGIKDFCALAVKPEAYTLDENKPSYPFEASVHEAFEKSTLFNDLLSQAYSKSERAALIAQTEEKFAQEQLENLTSSEEREELESLIKSYVSSMMKKYLRANMVSTQKRLDKRDHDQVRAIECVTKVLKAPHGSSLFTRGETQSLCTITLGTGRDYQIVDNLGGEEKKEYFMLHYNFPPFSVGEIGMMGSPKRREIGHGKLAYKAIEPLMPSQSEFPYVVRAVSEILESNGSSSMATVCSTSLALMDAGVPLKAPVAGIAMGLIKEGENYAILSDISGEEDHFGDMDFKVAGTEHGITALQMDIKIAGIPSEVMARALSQANQGRLHILSIMNQHLKAPRDNIASHAPHIHTMKVRQDKIRDIIGKGGSMIKSIAEKSGATVDVNDDGQVNIVSTSQESSQIAIDIIEQITKPLVVGELYSAQVTKFLEFGFVVSTVSGQDGLVHISSCPFPIEEMNENLKMGQKIEVKLTHIDRQSNRYKFSLLSDN
jgi:polyribonucleotide nucleotidyltransferase